MGIHPTRPQQATPHILWNDPPSSMDANARTWMYLPSYSSRIKHETIFWFFRAACRMVWFPISFSSFGIKTASRLTINGSRPCFWIASTSRSPVTQTIQCLILSCFQKPNLHVICYIPCFNVVLKRHVGHAIVASSPSLNRVFLLTVLSKPKYSIICFREWNVKTIRLLAKALLL